MALALPLETDAAQSEDPSLRGLGEQAIIFNARTPVQIEHNPIFDPRAAFSLRAQTLDTEVLDTILRLSSEPGIISFAGGLVGFLPSREVEDRLDRQVRELDPNIGNYKSTEGYAPLRDVGAELFRRLGSPVESPENVIINSGGQQSIDLIGKILINPGDTVVTESPTYPGIMGWQQYGADIVPLPTDDEGMDPGALEDILKDPARRIPFMYNQEYFQNPGGFQMSWRRKEQIAYLAEKYNVRIVTDIPYRLLRYEGEEVKPISSLIPGTIEIFSVSKIYKPAARLAFVRGPKDVLSMMVKAKQAADLFTGHEGQARLFYYLTSDDFVDHVYTIRAGYKERRDVMLDLLDRFLPGWVKVRAKGGMFLYGTDPEGIVNTTELLPIAARMKVAFVPGAGCYPPKYAYLGENSMRINFSYMTPEQTREGIPRLAQAIDAYKGRN